MPDTEPKEQQEQNRYAPSRITVDEAAELISTAATALEHQHPVQWSTAQANKLRGAAVLLRKMAKRDDVLDYLDDCVDGDDLLFRVAVSPDMYRSEPGRYEEVTVCLYGEGKETATDALRRFAKERGDNV